MQIPFNQPYCTGKELEYLQIVCQNHLLAGDNAFTKKCHQWFEEHIKCKKALLTHSGTGALEMAAMLIDVQSGDEIIMPSYTFSSTANAFILRGGVPVFVDIREDTLNIDENKIESAITSKTKAIVVVHYAGVSCEMEKICSIAKKYNLYLIEDAAQGLLSYYHTQPLGSIGHLAAVSFHETKNIISGEGGMLLINDEKLIDRAEIIREKGTNRTQFYRGEVDKYTWVDIGSSYLPSDLIAAYLYAQLEKSYEITQYRLELWQTYYNAFQCYEEMGLIRRSLIPKDITHNGHIFYLIMNNAKNRNEFIKILKEKGIHAIFHYIPLHSSPAGLKYGRQNSSMEVTDKISKQLVRLPMWVGLKPYQKVVVDSCCETLDHIYKLYKLQQINI